MCLEIYWGLIIVVISKYRQISSFFWNLISLDFLFDRIVQLFLLFTRALLFLNISIFYLLRQEDSTFNVYENSTLVTRVLACKILDMLLESRLSKISKKEKKKKRKKKEKNRTKSQRWSRSITSNVIKCPVSVIRFESYLRLRIQNSHQIAKISSEYAPIRSDTK